MGVNEFIAGFGVLLSIVGVLLFVFMEKQEEKTALKLPGGIEIETQTPSIVIFLVGAILIIAPLVYPGQSVKPEITSKYDGRYIGERGYYNPPNGYENECRKKYNFTATIKGNKVSSHDKSLRFTGLVSNEGILRITSSNINPPTKKFFLVSGPFESASMQSEFCGIGYFKLTGQ